VAGTFLGHTASSSTEATNGGQSISLALRLKNNHDDRLTASSDEVTIMAHVRSAGLVFPVLLIALVLIGCSGGGSDSDRSDAPTFAGAAATAAPAAASASGSGSGADALFDFSSSPDAPGAPGAPGSAGQPGAVGLPGSPAPAGSAAATVSNSLDIQVRPSQHLTGSSSARSI